MFKQIQAAFHCMGIDFLMTMMQMMMLLLLPLMLLLLLLLLPLSDCSGENFPCLSHASDAGHSAYAPDAEKPMALMMLKTDGAIEHEGA